MTRELTLTDRSSLHYTEIFFADADEVVREGDVSFAREEKRREGGIIVPQFMQDTIAVAIMATLIHYASIRK